ncbi:MAG: hypothetical protein WC805_03430 [Patescibacteria group bacterium]|jgi:hypothetical protein
MSLFARIVLGDLVVPRTFGGVNDPWSIGTVVANKRFVKDTIGSLLSIKDIITDKVVDEISSNIHKMVITDDYPRITDLVIPNGGSAKDIGKVIGEIELDSLHPKLVVQNLVTSEKTQIASALVRALRCYGTRWEDFPLEDMKDKILVFTESGGLFIGQIDTIRLVTVCQGLQIQLQKVERLSRRPTHLWQSFHECRPIIIYPFDSKKRPQAESYGVISFREVGTVYIFENKEIASRFIADKHTTAIPKCLAVSA